MRKANGTVSPPLKWSPWFAYDCMVTAFHEQRWWAASVISKALLKSLEIPGKGASRWFKVKKWIIVSEIARESEARLTEEGNSDAESARAALENAWLGQAKEPRQELRGHGRGTADVG